MQERDDTLDVASQRRPRGRGLAPHLFLALECSRPAAGGLRICLDGIDEVRIGRAQERAVRRGEGTILQVAVPDRWMSKEHVALRRTGGHFRLEDLGSKNGSFVNAEARREHVLADGDLLELGHSFFIFRAALPVGDPPDLEAPVGAAGTRGLATLLPSLEQDLRRLQRIACAGADVLVYGQSGTGKELVARAIHALSGRSGSFVALNCTAIPPTLVETELFGFRKGSFSGASEDRPGLVRAAHEGTLFLDEIADLPEGAQGALLRVLQEREVVPVGSTRPVPVSLRVVAACQDPLDARVASGRFRGDLFARLAGFVFSLPRLAERREDMGLILADILARLPDGKVVAFSPEAARVLFRHGWPFNVRELEKCVSSAAVIAAKGAIELEDLPLAVREGEAPSTRAPPPQEDAPALSPEEAKRRDELVALLREHQGNVTAVARALGKARMQVQRWIKRYRIERRTFRS